MQDVLKVIIATETEKYSGNDASERETSSGTKFCLINKCIISYLLTIIMQMKLFNQYQFHTMIYQILS